MKKAFTLIELLVVVLIIGILSSIALPQYAKTVERARMSEGVSNLSSLEKAVDMYLLANGYPSNSNTVIFLGDQANSALDVDFSNKSFVYDAYCTSGSCYLSACRDEDKNGVCEDDPYELDSVKGSGASTWTRFCMYNTGKEYLCKGVEALGFSRSAC